MATPPPCFKFKETINYAATRAVSLVNKAKTLASTLSAKVLDSAEIVLLFAFIVFILFKVVQLA